MVGQEEIGRRIKRAREDADMTQQELATAIGLEHPQSISRYERGESEVPAKRLRRIAEQTDKPMSFFVQDADELAQPTATAIDPTGAERFVAAVEIFALGIDRLEQVAGRFEQVADRIDRQEPPAAAGPPRNGR